jgi:hypothetical protein
MEDIIGSANGAAPFEGYEDM